VSMPDPERHAGRRFAGGCLLAVGLMIATLCGACTLLVAGSFLFGALGPTGRMQLSMILTTLMVPAIIGGVPTAIGVALAVVGWRMLRRPRPRSPPEDTFS
jgi:hypothetical protein